MSAFTRRKFLAGLGLLTLASGKAKASSLPANSATRSRYAAALSKRQTVLRKTFSRRQANQKKNSDEKRHGRVALFTKGLPHDSNGLASSRSFSQLKAAMSSGKQSDFEKINMGGAKRFKNPLAAYTFDMLGWDGCQLSIPPAPSVKSKETAAEMIELYWMALARDVPFADYGTDPIIAAAISELSSLSGYKGINPVTADNIFRMNIEGCLSGPFVSQFLLKDIPTYSHTTSAAIKTAKPNKDYLTDYTFWLANQNGFQPGVVEFDTQNRYIRNARDLGHFFHLDFVFESFINATNIIRNEIKAPLDSGNPYVASLTMDGFGTFDYPHLYSLLGEVTTRALKACWYQKWAHHRRLRPEAYGGLVHNKITKGLDLPIDDSILNSNAIVESFDKFGTYLLPQSYPEGAPGHPAYPSGHATVAGACATILKAWFEETTSIPNPVVASSDGLSRLAYNGSLSLRGEINKLAMNQCIGRLFSGVHYRSDAIEGLMLGEEVAIGILREVARLSVERDWSLTFTKFNGRRVRIRKG